MEGPPPSSSSSSTADDDLCTLAAQTRGMIPRAVEQIFDSAISLAEQGWQVTGGKHKQINQAQSLKKQLFVYKLTNINAL